MLESQDPTFEFVNYYGNTSLFALDVLRRHGRLGEMNLLSIAARMPHLADYLAVFRTVHHNTLVTTRLPVPPGGCPAELTLHQTDLFALGRLDVDCVISHAALHCLNDTRYGNANSQPGWQRPYQAAVKLREIVGPKAVPVVVSVSVNREEGFFDNNAHLAHDKFVRSFGEAGFELREHFFDYVCGGIPQRPEYLDYEYRRSPRLPERSNSPREWVVGNYYFC